VWGNAEYNKKLSLEQNVLASLSMLSKFLVVSKYEHIDGFVTITNNFNIMITIIRFVFAISDEKYGSTTAALGETVCRVLTCLADVSPHPYHFY
jgi:hypothetical protein